MNDNLQKVKERIIKAVPEIVELKFGCEIRRNGSLPETYLITGFNLVKIYFRHVSVPEKIDSFDRDSFREKFDVIGRPIQLADVLRATETRIEVSSHGDGAIYHYPNGDHKARVFAGNWNLSHDLSGQSEETIEFLYSILCK